MTITVEPSQVAGREPPLLVRHTGGDRVAPHVDLSILLDPEFETVDRKA